VDTWGFQKMRREGEEDERSWESLSSNIKRFHVKKTPHPHTHTHVLVKTVVR
jgi:hypothetical protein